MSVRVCTCIRAEDPRLVAVPDPTCPHPSVEADQDALRTATSLGRLIVVAFALAVALAPAATWPGTWTATTGLLTGTALIARLIHVAMKGQQT